MDPIALTGGGSISLVAPHSEHVLRLDGTKIVPGIAERWELASDGLSWTFYIRRGVKFQNLTEVTGKDVKFSLERFASKQAALSALRDIIDRIELVDDYTVRIYTKGKQPFLTFYVGMWAPQYGIVMPKDYIEANGLDYYKRHPIGAGPYKMVRYVPGDMGRYEAFEQYWRGAPAFKTLDLIQVPEQTTRVAMLKTGTVDAVDIDIESAVELERAGFRTFTTAIYTPTVMFIGVHDPRAAGMPMADIRVRQALSLAINRDEMGKAFFLGKLGPVMPAFLSESHADIDVPYWRDYAAKLYRYDPEKAKQLLAEAGYAKGLSFKLYNYSLRGGTYLPKMAEVLQAYWARIGVNAEMAPIDWGAIRAQLLARPQPMQLIGQACTGRYLAEPNIISALSFGYTTGTYGLYYGSPEYKQFDDLLLAAQSETNEKKRQEIVAQVVKAVTDSYTAIQIGSISDMLAIGPKVDANLPTPTISIPMFTDLFRHRK